MLQFQTVNWWQNQTTYLTSFYLHMFVDFYFWSHCLSQAVTCSFCAHLYKDTVVKQFGSEITSKEEHSKSLLDHSGMWLKWFVHDHIISTNTESWQGAARFCWSNSYVKLYLLKAATALIILFRADLGKQITWSKWKRIITLLLCWKAPSFFKFSVHFLLEYANVFLKVSEI